MTLNLLAGVCDEAVIMYHDFSTDKNDLCSPPRTKPAPNRRRGESSTDWLAVRAMFNCGVHYYDKFVTCSGDTVGVFKIDGITLTVLGMQNVFWRAVKSPTLTGIPVELLLFPNL